MKSVKNCDKCQKSYFTHLDICPKCQSNLEYDEKATYKVVGRAKCVKSYVGMNLFFGLFGLFYNLLPIHLIFKLLKEVIVNNGHIEIGLLKSYIIYIILSSIPSFIIGCVLLYKKGEMRKINAHFSSGYSSTVDSLKYDLVSSGIDAFNLGVAGGIASSFYEAKSVINQIQATKSYIYAIDNELVRISAGNYSTAKLGECKIKKIYCDLAFVFFTQ